LFLVNRLVGVPFTLRWNLKFILLLAALIVFVFIGIRADSKWQTGQVYIPIIMYHSISDTPVGAAELSVTTKSFEQQMKYLSDNGYTPIYFDEIKNCAKIKKPIIVTFDDGYSDNYTNAYPVLKKYNIKATIFMITKLIDTNGYLSKDQITSMEDLVSFQSHTVDHLRLDVLNLKQIKYECNVSQKSLSAITKKAVYVLSYPNGRFRAPVNRIASEYYDFAVTTQQGINTLHSDKQKMKRSAVARAATLSDFVSLLG
jgi:peptidoglycan/xylan/chitin deacetylase (PgdA/CDA1 family)